MLLNLSKLRQVEPKHTLDAHKIHTFISFYFVNDFEWVFLHYNDWQHKIKLIINITVNVSKFHTWLYSTALYIHGTPCDTFCYEYACSQLIHALAHTWDMIGHLNRKQFDCFLKLKAKANIDKHQQYGRLAERYSNTNNKNWTKTSAQLFSLSDHLVKFIRHMTK